MKSKLFNPQHPSHSTGMAATFNETLQFSVVSYKIDIWFRARAWRALPCFASSLEALKATADGALGSLIQWVATLPMAGGWNKMSFKFPSNLSLSVALQFPPTAGWALTAEHTTNMPMTMQQQLSESCSCSSTSVLGERFLMLPATVFQELLAILEPQSFTWCMCYTAACFSKNWIS